mmetsp:Transcript_17202/g.60444  ORF Transcript_17202/g.60444 Transcript_17202/m.60444 type:complete len:291 (+) Transcript_17202:25-897(+)
MLFVGARWLLAALLQDALLVHLLVEQVVAQVVAEHLHQLHAMHAQDRRAQPTDPLDGAVAPNHALEEDGGLQTLLRVGAPHLVADHVDAVAVVDALLEGLQAQRRLLAPLQHHLLHDHLQNEHAQLVDVLDGLAAPDDALQRQRAVQALLPIRAPQFIADHLDATTRHAALTDARDVHRRALLLLLLDSFLDRANLLARPVTAERRTYLGRARHPLHVIRPRKLVEPLVTLTGNTAALHSLNVRRGLALPVAVGLDGADAPHASCLVAAALATLNLLDLRRGVILHLFLL